MYGLSYLSYCIIGRVTRDNRRELCARVFVRLLATTVRGPTDDETTTTTTRPDDDAVQTTDRGRDDRALAVPITYLAFGNCEKT